MNMTAGKLFRKTMPFIWAKILLGGIAAIVAFLLLAAFAGIGWLFGEVGLVIAVIAEACRTGSVPAGQCGARL